jgi:hypothetical protein
VEVFVPVVEVGYVRVRVDECIVAMGVLMPERTGFIDVVCVPMVVVVVCVLVVVFDRVMSMRMLVV